MAETLPCPLCSGIGSYYHTQVTRHFYQCGNCRSVFLHPKDYLSSEAEKKHYQQYTSPVTNSILNDFKTAHDGLDFGSGTGSPILKVLTDNGYNVEQYDLYFHDNRELLQRQYDYIACSETAEHFKEPYEELRQLRNLLKPGGKLYIMTSRFEESRDFGTWSYKTDPTHVFLYHEKAFEWIREEFGFSSLVLEERLAILGL